MELNILISKKATILAILLVGLLAVGIASAADDSTNDAVSVGSTIDDAISVESDGADDMVGADDTANTAENDVLGSSINDDGSNDTTEKIGSTEQGAVVKSNDENENVLKDAADDQTLGETDFGDITVSGNTWYVNASADSGGDGSESSPFNNLTSAILAAADEDTIMIAAGEYKGTDNTGLTIDKNLTFIKYGDGEATFDAEKNSRIWTVTATSTNITGLTFKNGKAFDGGAIKHDAGILSLIDCIFDICSSYDGDWGNGGAVYTTGSYLIISRSSFNKCEASWGGAVYSENSVNVVTNCTFTGNDAYKGGAIYFTSGNITNCAFAYNSGSKGTAIYSDSDVIIENNWWGSNNPDWNDLLDGSVKTPSVYAVLNVTANPGEIGPSENSTIMTKFV